jgi:hypothetical protein
VGRQAIKRISKATDKTWFFMSPGNRHVPAAHPYHESGFDKRPLPVE